MSGGYDICADFDLGILYLMFTRTSCCLFYCSICCSCKMKTIHKIGFIIIIILSNSLTLHRAIETSLTIMQIAIDKFPYMVILGSCDCHVTVFPCFRSESEACW